MKIYIQVMGSIERTPFDYIPTTTVDLCRRQCMEISSRDADEFMMLYRGKKLLDGNTLYGYGVSNNDVVQIIPLQRKPRETKLVISGKEKESLIPKGWKLAVIVVTKANSQSRRDGAISIGQSLPTSALSPTPSTSNNNFSNNHHHQQQSNQNPSEIDDEMRQLQGLENDLPCEDCHQLFDNHTKLCNSCGCNLCGSKKASLFICDECEYAFHPSCFAVPEKDPIDTGQSSNAEDHWFCQTCRADNSKIDTDGSKHKAENTKRGKSLGAKREGNWGGGQGNVGLTKKCDIVDAHHFGPIPGVDVGQTYEYRMQLAEAGVHRPPVAGIAGQGEIGCQSIVLSGSFARDIDQGDEFYYTGSGGKDLKNGNRRTAKNLTSHQTFTAVNKALAMNCNATFNAEGAEAKNWRAGKPIRVCRKFRKGDKGQAQFYPDAGYRYDGIYKVVKYWKEIGNDNFKECRYLLRRDDELEGPYTPAGKARIEKEGLVMVMAEKQKKDVDDGQADNKEKGKKRGADNAAEKDKPAKKRPAWVPPADLIELMKNDKRNIRIWGNLFPQIFALEANAAASHRPLPDISTNPIDYRSLSEFLDSFASTFVCCVCQEFVVTPITTPCTHTFCEACLHKSVNTSPIGLSCPACMWPLILTTHTEHLRSKEARAEYTSLSHVNFQLIEILKYLKINKTKQQK